METNEPSARAPWKRSVQTTAVWRAGMPALLGFLLVGASVATVIIGTSHANRPHEVKGEALFAVLLVAHGIVCVVVLWFLLVAWRSRGEKALRLVHVVPTLFASGYSGLVLYFLAMITRDFLR